MTHSAAGDRIIVALDVDARDAFAIARSLEGTVRWLKVGLTLFYQEGPGVVQRLSDFGFEVFLDLKLHDIPHQVESASATIARLGARMITVHAAGGSVMVDAAVRGARRGAEDVGLAPPAVLGVTVLTSMTDAGMQAVGVGHPVSEQVPLLARVAHAGGADGVVCSPHEAAVMRSMLGEDGLVVTPGVRPAGTDSGDQSRVATPRSALEAGASHLVIGRPITGVPDPAQAAMRIIAELEEVDQWPSL